MFIQSNYTRVVVLITLLGLPLLSAHAQDDTTEPNVAPVVEASPEIIQENPQDDKLISKSAFANLTYVRTTYELSGPNVDQNIDTDTVKLKLGYSKLLTPKYVLFSTAQIYQVTIADNVTATEKNELMGGAEVGARYLINGRFSATLSGELQRMVYFQVANKLVSGGGHWNPILSAAGYYQAWSRPTYSIIPSMKVSLIFGTGDAKMGSAYAVNATYNYYLPAIRVSAGVGYESRTQKFDALKLTESGPQLSIGAGLSF